LVILVFWNRILRDIRICKNDKQPAHLSYLRKQVSSKVVREGAVADVISGSWLPAGYRAGKGSEICLEFIYYINVYRKSG